MKKLRQFRNWWAWVFIHMCFVDSVVLWGLNDENNYYNISLMFYEKMKDVASPARLRYSRQVARIRRQQALDTKYLGL